MLLLFDIPVCTVYYNTSSKVCSELLSVKIMNLNTSRVPQVSTSARGTLSLQLKLSRNAALENMRLLGGSLVDHVGTLLPITC